ncbi:MAG: ribonuclease activity regulator RraA [Pseudomonadales bacterium]|nr:ribonuclease activity regulator RraA [Pseudomonadales bacterium]
MTATTPSEAIPQALNPDLEAALNSLATATLTHQLQMRGIRGTFLTGLKPLQPGKRMVGRARTLRYVALREDLQRTYGGGINAQKRIVEAIESGDVLVIEARGVADAATIGDIFATRVFALGGRGIVTDGALRDTPAIADIGEPVYHLASHGATLGRQHMPFSTDEPITCAGVFVMPGDIIVGDAEGVVVIPVALVEEVTKDALAQEEKEDFALERIAAGESTIGLFPLSKERVLEFETWKANRNNT